VETVAVGALRSGAGEKSRAWPGNLNSLGPVLPRVQR
jgi:hypothetical protein